MIKINQNYQLLVSEIYAMLKILHMWKNIHAINVYVSTEDIFIFFNSLRCVAVGIRQYYEHYYIMDTYYMAVYVQTHS